MYEGIIISDVKPIMENWDKLDILKLIDEK